MFTTNIQINIRYVKNNKTKECVRDFLLFIHWNIYIIYISILFIYLYAKCSEKLWRNWIIVWSMKQLWTKPPKRGFLLIINYSNNNVIEFVKILTPLRKIMKQRIENRSIYIYMRVCVWVWFVIFINNVYPIYAINHMKRTKQNKKTV